MSIENIKSRLKTLEKEANDNEQLRANSHESSLFYAKDVDTYFIMWCYKSVLMEC